MAMQISAPPPPTRAWFDHPCKFCGVPGTYRTHHRGTRMGLVCVRCLLEREMDVRRGLRTPRKRATSVTTYIQRQRLGAFVAVLAGVLGVTHADLLRAGAVNPRQENWQRVLDGGLVGWRVRKMLLHLKRKAGNWEAAKAAAKAVVAYRLAHELA